MRAILGHKVGMTQVWDDSGRLIGVTVIKAEPSQVIDRKDEFTTLGQVDKGKTNKAQRKIAEILESKRGIWLHTFKGLEAPEDKVGVDSFSTGEFVAISGVTKGKGFAGVVKRHGFAGWPASHGHSHQRRPGSIGAQQPQRVLKGKKMAGHMGAVNLTVRGNKVVSVDLENGLLIVSGAVPGAKRSKVIVRSLERNDKN
ncbi:50S ribosomal protein L3 [Candidatus Berkelbacteria bacterium RIFCSPLOWO2_01_FULL_50_28]|uniref:50S ribosomal protein L3 n=1 Tax=Candidatus Berkelbacteria bacterium RIFCSPLOWO2_01_FULL_50_28 TaxID=1797471 RepID=A0A1F5EBY1_9BACT|nr:MAG: 50S ribosomal protein L3 [Candidatus Berkelbacteria bacterium RIFCSPHIGHO2_01_FULL_50_36]OGD64917.1 MAG: 50S ribosomal protein L3 [Candidatus Berkelbacteria bacterium RIFCSPLOWO2_01_FULL_50_28]